MPKSECTYCGELFDTEKLYPTRKGWACRKCRLDFFDPLSEREDAGIEAERNPPLSRMEDGS